MGFVDPYAEVPITPRGAIDECDVCKLHEKIKKMVWIIHSVTLSWIGGHHCLLSRSYFGTNGNFWDD